MRKQTLHPAIEPDEYDYYYKDDGDQLLRNSKDDAAADVLLFWRYNYDGDGQWRIHPRQWACLHDHETISPRQASSMAYEIDAIKAAKATRSLTDR